MEELISTFHIDLKLLIAQMINFGIVFVVLYLFALKPLMKLMNERSEKIEKGLKDADVNAKKLEETQEEYKKTVMEARKEAQTIVENAKSDAESKRSEMITKAKEEVGALLESGKKQLSGEKEKMLGEARTELASLVTEATRRVLGETVTLNVDKEIIERNI